LSKLYPKDVDAPADGVDDMTKLAYLHEPGVLHNLKTRYMMNEIYVRLPPTFSLKSWQTKSRYKGNMIHDE